MTKQELEQQQERLLSKQAELKEKLQYFRNEIIRVATDIFGFCPLLPDGEVNLDELNKLVINRQNE